ncbi:MAG: ATP-binding protein [Eubacteriaceae bacterium]
MQNNREAYKLLLEKQTAFQLKKRIAKEKLYAKIPELDTVDREINLVGIALTRATLKKDEAEIKTLKDEMLALAKHKLALAKGYEPLLEKSYYCLHCKDSGIINGAPCNCLSQCFTEINFSNYDLKKQALKETFDTFNPHCYSDTPLSEGTRNPRANALKIKNAMEVYCDRYESIPDHLLFTGNPGTGKTFMSNCISNALSKKGYSIIYITAAHLISTIQDQIFRDGKTNTEAFEPLLLCDLLIIDDLGAEHSTEYSQKQLYEVIDSRLIAGKKMIISTNLTIPRIKDLYDERLSSRIRGNFKVFPFFGDDIRLLKIKS